MADRQALRAARRPQRVNVRRARPDDVGAVSTARETVGPRTAEAIRHDRAREREIFNAGVRALQALYLMLMHA